jgi:hypothetical protein
MTTYQADGFRNITQGQDTGGMIVETMSDAAKIFGNRLAKRYGRSHHVIVCQDSWTNGSALYQMTVVGHSGVVETQEWIHISAV